MIIVAESVKGRCLEPRSYAAFELGSCFWNEKSGREAKGRGATELVIGVVAYVNDYSNETASRGGTVLARRQPLPPHPPASIGRHRRCPQSEILIF